MRPTNVTKRLPVPYRRLHLLEDDTYQGQGEQGQLCVQINKHEGASTYGSIGGLLAFNHPLANGRSMPVVGGPPGYYLLALWSDASTLLATDLDILAAAGGTITSNFDKTLSVSTLSSFFHVEPVTGFSRSAGTWTVPDGIWMVTVKATFAISTEATQVFNLYGLTSETNVRVYSQRGTATGGIQTYVNWVVCVNSSQSTDTTFQLRTDLASATSVLLLEICWDKLAPVLTEVGTRPTAT